jgi:hypothetical protein
MPLAVHTVFAEQFGTWRTDRSAQHSANDISRSRGLEESKKSPAAAGLTNQRRPVRTLFPRPKLLNGVLKALAIIASIARTSLDVVREVREMIREHRHHDG